MQRTSDIHHLTTKPLAFIYCWYEVGVRTDKVRHFTFLFQDAPYHFDGKQNVYALLMERAIGIVDEIAEAECHILLLLEETQEFLLVCVEHLALGVAPDPSHLSDVVANLNESVWRNEIRGECAYIEIDWWPQREEVL